MKLNPESDLNDELRPEYTEEAMKNMVRGKHAGRFNKTIAMVTLEPDVALIFPNSAAVNEALRFLIRVTKEKTSENAQQEAA